MLNRNNSITLIIYFQDKASSLNKLVPNGVDTPSFARNDKEDKEETMPRRSNKKKSRKEKDTAEDTYSDTLPANGVDTPSIPRNSEEEAMPHTKKRTNKKTSRKEKDTVECPYLDILPANGVDTPSFPRKEEDTVEWTYLDTLPDIPMLLILKQQHLPGLMNLCEAVPRIEYMVDNPKYWHHVRADMWAMGGKDLIHMMSPYSKYITSLTLQCTDDRVMQRTQSAIQRQAVPVDEMLLKRLEQFPQLQNVSIEGAVLPSSALLKLPPYVKTLKLIKCSMQQPLKGSAGWEEEEVCNKRFTTRRGRGIFPCLRSFHFTDTTKRSDIDILRNVLSQTVKLEELDISRADIRDDESDIDLLYKQMKGVLSTFGFHCMSKIRKLRVIRAGQRNDINDECVLIIMRPMFHKSLEELHLNACPQLTDAALLHVREARSLTLLNLAGCTGITAGAVDNLRIDCPNLKVIH